MLVRFKMYVHILNFVCNLKDDVVSAVLSGLMYKPISQFD